MLNDKPVLDGFKICSRKEQCKHPAGPILPANSQYFSPRTVRRSGFQSQCKVCHSGAERNRRAANPDRIRSRDREYHRLHREVKLARNRERYHKDVLESRKKIYKWRNEYPEKAKESGVRFRKTHQDLIRISNRRHKARKQSLLSTFTLDEWNRALNYWNGACAYCRHSPSLWDTHWVLHQEHYIPSSKGGNYTADNILPVCQTCNISKGAKDVNEWLSNKIGPRKAANIIKKVSTYFEIISKAQVE